MKVLYFQKPLPRKESLPPDLSVTDSSALLSLSDGDVVITKSLFRLLVKILDESKNQRLPLDFWNSAEMCSLLAKLKEVANPPQKPPA